jgi:hypothetical protein
MESSGKYQHVQRTSLDVRIVAALERKPVELDTNLPVWARRSNPIIRRHLGMYWKTILPEMGFLVKVVLVQAGLILLTVPMPFLFSLALPTITAAFLLFPVAVYLYGHLLVSIGYASSSTTADEIRNGTLSLLRVTPIDLQAILRSKIAAAMWRQIDNLGLLLIAAALFSLPILISQYATLWPPDEYPALSRAAMIIGLVVSLVRLMIEPVMIGAIGAMAGAALHVRYSAGVTTLLIGFSYFLLINLPRFIPMSWPMRFVTDFALPLVLPLVITWIALKVASYLLARE